LNEKGEKIPFSKIGPKITLEKKDGEEDKMKIEENNTITIQLERE
jgi:hypothetical protein